MNVTEYPTISIRTDSRKKIVRNNKKNFTN